ncbi:MAG: hypothetical protein ACI85F_001189 [Bacteroidia bacterium]|jgi:hypothetical protein
MNDSFDISAWVRITSDWVGSSIKIVDSLITYPNENGEDEDAYKVTASKLATTLYRTLDINHPKFFKMDDQSKLGFVGSYILLDDIRSELEANDEAVALLFANNSSSLKTDRKYQETVGSEGTGSPAKFVYTLPNIVIGEICIYWKQCNETQFLVLSEFDSEALFKHAQILFNESSCKHVLIGWTEVGNDELDGLFVLLTKNEAGLATVNDLSQLYTQ